LNCAFPSDPVRPLSEAKATLLVMQDLIKTATTVRRGSRKLVAGLERMHVNLRTSLDKAQSGLREVDRHAA
jgi:hypothetical protein